MIEHLVKTVGKNELKTNYKQHVVDVKNVMRERIKQKSMENRYKVVNCCRSLDTLNTNELEDTMTVIDIEDSLSCSTDKNLDSETVRSDILFAYHYLYKTFCIYVHIFILFQLENFVYDLYYTQTGGDMKIDDLISVHGLEQEFVFDKYRDEDNSSNGYETEDSNSESHWWNDYPDTEHSDLSVDEDDMRRAVMNINLDDEESSDLSSEDDFVYAINKKDVEQYGYKYARYKAKIKQELSDAESDSSDGIFESRDDDHDISLEKLSW